MIIFALWINTLNITSAIVVWTTTKYDYQNPKDKLKTIKNWDNYVKKIDSIIEKLDKNKLKKLISKLKNIKNKIENKKDLQSRKILLIINYFNYKAELKILSLKESEIVSKLEQMKNPSLSEIEQKKVQDKLVKIQLNLLENTQNVVNNTIKNFEKLTNYEEAGDMKVKFSVDHETVWKIKSEIKLNNYKIKTSNFDSQITGQIEALIDASIKWEESFKLQLNTFIDFIQKDWNIYVLLKDLKIVNNSQIKELKDSIEKLKEIAKENKYIKIEDRQTKEALKLLSQANPTKFFQDSKAFLEKPMFKAYKKEGNKYYLVPTKYACDKYKEVMVKFDPWNGSSCSDSQYEKMLKSLADSWNLYIELWTKNKLAFDAYPDFSVKSFNSYIIFTDNSVEEINSKLVAKKAWEWFELNYIKNSKLDFNLNAWEKAKLDFNSKLDRNNKFTSINSSINTKWYRDNLKANFKLENKKISGDFEYSDEKYDWYDYNTWKTKYKPWNKIIWKLTWTQDYKNTINNLDLNISGTDLSTNKDFLEAQLTKQYNNYTTKLKISEDKKTIFESNFKINNKKISGNSIIFNKGKQYIKITHSWLYEPKHLELNNKIEFNENPLNLYTGQISDQKAEINFNIKADIRYNRDNANIYIDFKEWTKKILEIEIDNKWRIEYKKVEIKTPTNVKEIEKTNTQNYY